MQSSPPRSAGKARALRELSASLSHSTRSISPVIPAPSDAEPTKRSGFSDTLDFFDNEDLLASTQHNMGDETNELPQFRGIRSTAKRINAWQMPRSEQPMPDTSMVNKQFLNFDNTISDEGDVSIEQARGGSRSNQNTPLRVDSRAFDSLYDITPPTVKSRKSYAAETGSLRRDAQIRRASRNELDMAASPGPIGSRKSPAVPVSKEQKQKRGPSLAQLHAKVSEDESSFVEERPPTVTLPANKSSRWGNARARQTSLQTDGVADVSSGDAAVSARPATAPNSTVQSFILPDLPNLTELVSGVFDDGTPVFSKDAPPRSRFSAVGSNGNPGRRAPGYVPVDSVPIPQEEKAIFSSLQMLQDKVTHLEQQHAEAEKRNEAQELEIIELRATVQVHEKSGRGGSGSGELASSDGLDAHLQTLRTKLDRMERKTAVLEIEKKRLSTERDNLTNQLRVAFQNCEELKVERAVLTKENGILRSEIDEVHAEVEALRGQLVHEQTQHHQDTVQLQQQIEQEDATRRQNRTLQAELNRVRAQNDEHTLQLAQKELDLQAALQEQAEYARLKADHDALQSQLASLKAKREADLRSWQRQETHLKARIDARDANADRSGANPQQSRESMQITNAQLRNELASLNAQHVQDGQVWSRRESELKRRIGNHQGTEKTRNVLGSTSANGQQRTASEPLFADKENNYVAGMKRMSSHRGDENTRTRIRNRVRQEVRNSKVVPSNAGKQSMSMPHGLQAGASRSFSLPLGQGRAAEIDDDMQSTTDLSLEPRSASIAQRDGVSGRLDDGIMPPPPQDDDTQLSLIKGEDVARIRRQLEEQRLGDRRRAISVPLERTLREETMQSERFDREDTVQSVMSNRGGRRQSLPRKSSLKDVTGRTNITEFEEDLTGRASRAPLDPTQTKQSMADASMLSNTSRRRRSAPTEMTSAFILPDLKLAPSESNTAKRELLRKLNEKHHDNQNCTVCRRDAGGEPTAALRVPKLVPVSSKKVDESDATMRPAQSPMDALALVIKGLRDERAHLHIEVAIIRSLLEGHDPSAGRKKRLAFETEVASLLAKIHVKDDQIYSLYDVLEGQKRDEIDITEQLVEDLTDQIRADDAELEKKSKERKVTIQSFHEDDSELDGEEELPWEGFEDTAERSFTGGSMRLGIF